MNPPRRRRSRPKGRARLALAGDFPDTGESVTEAARWHGRPFEGASIIGLPDGAVYGPAPDAADTPEWWRP